MNPRSGTNNGVALEKSFASFVSGMKDGHDFDGLNCLPQNPYVES